MRREPSGGVRRWHANPFWVRLRLLDGERVEKYLTLEGNGREIELGAFLSPGGAGGALRGAQRRPDPPAVLTPDPRGRR